MKHWLYSFALASAIALQFPAVAAANPPAVHTAESNRVIMQSFVRILYDQGKVRAAYEKYVAPDLIQHNPNIADGREAAITELEALLRDPNAKFDVQRVVVDGDLAVVHFKGTLGKQGPGAAVVEIFRLRNGLIVEHWDVFQILGVQSKNPHPYF